MIESTSITPTQSENRTIQAPVAPGPASPTCTGMATWTSLSVDRMDGSITSRT
jgi:hypothetical protein